MLEMSDGANERKRDRDDDDGADYTSIWPKTRAELHDRGIIRAWKPQVDPRAMAPDEYPGQRGQWKDPKGDPILEIRGHEFSSELWVPGNTSREVVGIADEVE